MAIASRLPSNCILNNRNSAYSSMVYSLEFLMKGVLEYFVTYWFVKLTLPISGCNGMPLGASKNYARLEINSPGLWISNPYIQREDNFFNNYSLQPKLKKIDFLD